MWSAGCLLYQICMLCVPFQANSFDDLTKKIIKAEYDPIPRYILHLIAFTDFAFVLLFLPLKKGRNIVLHFVGPSIDQDLVRPITVKHLALEF